MKLYLTRQEYIRLLQKTAYDKDKVAIDIRHYEKCTNCDSNFIPSNENGVMCKQCSEMFRVSY